MVAIQQDIVIDRRGTFELPVICYDRDPDTLQLVIRDLAGWTGAMQIRATADDTTVLGEATVDIDVATGVVTATIDDIDTAAYVWRSGVYDLVITDGVSTDYLVEGSARVRRSITVP